VPRRRVDRILNVAEMREQACRLPRVVFDAIDGGAGDEVTMRANRSAYERIWIKPKVLVDVRVRDMSTTVLGTPISMPVMTAPCSFGRMAHSDAELAVARASASAGTIYVCPGGSSYPPERVMAAAAGPKWYQLYLPGDRRAAESILSGVGSAGYEVLCVTVDTAVIPGSRERDYRNRLDLPLQLRPRLLLAGISHPRWAWDFLFGRVGRSDVGPGALRRGYEHFANTVTSAVPVTAEDLRWLRDRWKGPLVVKGLQRADDVPLLLDLGIDGVVVSNHGGRNQDGVSPSIAVLPEVVEAVDGRMEVYLDGGIMRGWDVFKALGLGARAVLIGKAYMYGLAVAGEAGVARVLEILRLELERTMALAGCASVRDLDSSFVSIDGRP
jgi:isopentenyl diphosphate isomerase/L-lactate dehydrogenase-like FMN-dependent dehydrogenase